MRATILIERSIKEQTFPSEIHEPHTLQRWLEQLPETLLEQRPVLCLSYATALLFQNTSWQPDAPTLPLLEKLLNTAEDGFRVEDNLTKLGELFAFRSLLALRQNNMQAANRIPVSLPHLAQDIQTAQARLALSVGDQMTTQRWATGRSPHPNFSREIEEELLVNRWLRIQDKLEEASSLLEPLLVATAQIGALSASIFIHQLTGWLTLRPINQAMETNIEQPTEHIFCAEKYIEAIHSFQLPFFVPLLGCLRK
jgi:hypothetical protein